MRKNYLILGIVFFFLSMTWAGDLGKFRRAKHPVSDRYLVVLKDSYVTTMEATKEMVVSMGGKLIEYYDPKILHGYLASLSERSAIEISKSDTVSFVEQDSQMEASPTMPATTSPQENLKTISKVGEIHIESDSPWNLDRISKTSLPLDGLYTYTLTGKGVNAYVIDTGIRTSHKEFEGRASVGMDVNENGDGQDCNGHGTHVAGIIGGKRFGAAKAVNLISVRVLDCGGKGSTSLVIAGVGWVTLNHRGPSVANMSLGDGISEALDIAVKNSIRSGVTYVAAAGNSNGTSCDTSPARINEVFTIGSTDRLDQMSVFSNYGVCVSLFAPGTDIQSAWNISDTATQVLSGTSMASPAVASVAALFLESHPTDTPEEVVQAITAAATAGKVLSKDNLRGPNLLLFTHFPGN